MKVIGLTGGIGSGKSTVSQFLAELGAIIIDADRVGHEAFKPGTELWQEVVAVFGQQIVTPSGDILYYKIRLGNMLYHSRSVSMGAWHTYLELHKKSPPGQLKPVTTRLSGKGTHR